MDLQWGNDVGSESFCNEDEDCNIDSVFEQERCGICIDIIIDRGVLDCCDHWFCFACIDNWAMITNLCPICKNEFQLITCLPVYDTRSNGLDQHPLSRNEDWYFQGTNSTLSFPSYYISEDAVKCLENDGCKIRSSVQVTEDDLSFDTSIACDSCDIWYHAFCVGFNPEFTSENLWLCPRCINNEVPAESGAVSLQSISKYSIPQTAEIGWIVDPSLSGKVSVSVADAGETAVVVSMIEGKQKTDCGTSFFDRHDSNMDIAIEKPSFYSDIENSEIDLQLKDVGCIPVSQNNLFFNDYKEHHTNVSAVDSSSEFFFDISPEIIDFQPDGDLKEVALSSFSDDATLNKPRNDITTSQSPSTSSPTLQIVPFSSYSEENDKGMTINALETSDSVYYDIYMDSSSVAHGTLKAEVEQEKKSDIIVGTCSANSSPSTDGIMMTSCKEDMVDIFQNGMEACNSTEKNMMCMPCTINMDDNNDCIRKRDPETVYPRKKLKLERKSKIWPSLDASQVCSSKNRGASLRYAKQEEAEAADIMSIVQESDCTSNDMPTEMKAANKSIGKGLRVKKIMRRVGEKRESSIVAQELGKEIKEVVQHKTLKGVGKSDLDEKLLAAFRAAIVRPQTELTNISEPFHIGAKKPLLVKGKKRENLTKKIYGTASGRRRHAWVRDLEIEFWRHRCRREQPDKVETLQSVLEILKKATNPHWNGSLECVSQEESKDSILSRVYLADASLFPRKDDIKPLSALSGSSQLDNHVIEKEMSSRNVAKGPFNDHINSKKNSIQISENSFQLKASYCDSIDKIKHAQFLPGETSNWKANSCKVTVESIQSSGSSASKESMVTSKEHSCLPDAKTDKRKWALEVLARKTSSTNLNDSKGQEDGYLLKGKYPLLAQLAQDMRPVLASFRHNKVPVSIRQVQLYRITEHYLRRANLPVIRRTAETELAVVDAVNVEKQIFERSNSKIVYVNLCSQAVSQLANKPESAEANVSNSPEAPIMIANEVTDDGTKSDTEIVNKTESADSDIYSSTLLDAEVSDQVSGDTILNPKVGAWNNVEEALKMAGLFSDSPPSSPYCATKDSNEDEFAQENVNYDAQYNVIHSMDTEGDDFMAQNPGKIVAMNDIINVDVKLPFDFSKTLEQHKESGPETTHAEIRMEDTLPQNRSEKGIYNEPALENCEGDNNNLLMSQISDESVEVLNNSLVTCEEKNPISGLKEEKNPISGLKENCILNDATGVSVTDTKGYISDPDCDSAHLIETSVAKENLETHSRENAQINPATCDNIPNEEIAKLKNDKSDLTISISKKVEAYIKEHIRPLCKSGVITAEQYRWAIRKTLDKVMKFHHKAKNANFLIREGEKVKKLAEQYVESAQQKELT